jgi:hypothetical protein
MGRESMPPNLLPKFEQADKFEKSLLELSVVQEVVLSFVIAFPNPSAAIGE